MATRPTQAEAAQHLDMTARRYRELVAEGKLPAGAPLDETRITYIRMLREHAAGRSSETGMAQKEKSRLDRMRADQVEFDLQVKRGEYAPIDALTFAIGEFASRACSIFDAIPKRVKNSLPTLRAREIKIIQREIDKAKQAASEIQIAFNTEADRDKD